MKIAMMTSWNVACGVSVHAELLGREWIRNDHRLKVFCAVDIEKANYRFESWSGEPIIHRYIPNGSEYTVNASGQLIRDQYGLYI